VINFGYSDPGPTTKQRHILEDEHATFYSYFIQNSLNVPEKRIILIARGKSATLTIKAANVRFPFNPHSWLGQQIINVFV
jgi:hypothetical protein